MWCDSVVPGTGWVSTPQKASLRKVMQCRRLTIADVRDRMRRLIQQIDCFFLFLVLIIVLQYSYYILVWNYLLSEKLKMFQL